MEIEREVLTLNLDDVLPNRFQPRIKFNEQNILELAESIKEHGVIQPIVVRKIGDKYEIIAGERRYKASVLAGKTTIPAIVTNLDDKNSAEIALIENVQRQDLTPIEEAVSYKKILDMGYLNQATLAEKLGKTQSTIANKLRLLNLDDEVQEALLEEKISERHARSLLKLNPQDQIKMLNRILTERLTVRKTDDEIVKMLQGGEIEEKQEKNNDTTEIKEIIPSEDLSYTEIPEQIEILDFSDSMPIGGQKMDEEIKNELNIPTAPIIEEIQPLEPITEIDSNEETKINPGFMDVEKIRSQARDIFQAQPPVETQREIEPEPAVVVDPIPVTPIEAQEVTSTDEEPSTSGGNRFFTMFNKQDEENNPNYVSDIESKEVNMGGITPPASSVFNFNPFDQSANAELAVEPTTIDNKEIPSFIDQVPNVGEYTQGIDDFMQPVTPYTLTDDQEFTHTETPTVNVGTEQSTNIVNQEISSEETEEIPVSYNEFTLEAVRPVPLEDTMNSMNPQSVIVEPEKQVTADLKTVINTIRTCAKTIEDYGYTIDTEELDFENSYQVTFKIDK